MSLTQILAWDLPSPPLCAAMADHAKHASGHGFTDDQRLGTGGRGRGQAQLQKVTDVLLRYNFPAAALTDDALRTLILMVLSTVQTCAAP